MPARKRSASTKAGIAAGGTKRRKRASAPRSSGMKAVRTAYPSSSSRKRSVVGARAKKTAPKTRRSTKRKVVASSVPDPGTVEEAPRVAPTTNASPALNVRRGIGFLLVLAFVMSGGLLIRSATAATFQGPSTAPPGGNIPVTIWNRLSTGAKQANAAIEVDGYIAADQSLTVGSAGFDLGSAAGGQNVLYGVATYALMHSSADYLFLLQTEAAGVYTNRFRVDRNGNLTTTGSVTVSGNVSPSGSVNGGSPTLNLGVGAAGQNVLYGVARYDQMHPSGDYLMKLQTHLSGVYTDRFTVNREGDVTAAGCFGPTLAGLTPASYASGVSPVLSYYAADNQCGAAFAGSHVCTAEELLRSISCSQAGDPVRTLEGEIAWINGGPPGYTSNANDCIGWTSNASTAYGRYWSFNNTTGGFGTMTSCNAPGLKFACCR